MRIRYLVAVFLISLALSCQTMATCSVSVPTVGFGNVSTSSSKTTSVTASVTCSALISLIVSYTLKFSTGSANIYNPRNMKNSNSNILTYNLYKDAAHSQILGNGTSSTVTIQDSYLLALGPVTRNYTIYASLPAQPLAYVGNYQDTITVTLTQP
ncbi:MAG: spore coat U domain-containing protein [Rickettsia endosymbiont of Graphium doson]|nr:spore coat U domain-containing protein [Rickettsia endosymbiont of Graphium doson]HJD67965.1 spore coat U domain-containing protein [Rickettsia endosymbiont of Bembidion lapponicum]